MTCLQSPIRKERLIKKSVEGCRGEQYAEYNWQHYSELVIKTDIGTRSRHSDEVRAAISPK